jgi:hypothetical protein
MMKKYTDEELLLELINRNVLGDAPSKTERFVKYFEVVVGVGNNNVAYITLPEDSYQKLCDIVCAEQKATGDVVCPVCDKPMLLISVLDGKETWCCVECNSSKAGHM